MSEDAGPAMGEDAGPHLSADTALHPNADTGPLLKRRACVRCLRRSWLLAELGGVLDCNCRGDGRLFDLLALPDEHLLRALAGRRGDELCQRHARFRPDELADVAGVEAICWHDDLYPRTLRGTAAAPPTLFVRGGLSRLARLTARPVVAVVGTTRATDYGVEMSRAIARGLAASGVTVVSDLADGIASAAHEGSLAAGGEGLAVFAGGLDVSAPVRRLSLLLRTARAGAALSELPCGTPPRRWSSAAAIRNVAALAELTIVVEAADSRRELAGATIARKLGRTVAAVPGRVTSRASCGPIALLRQGASLVTGPGDVLDLLCVGERRAQSAHAEGERLPLRLREVLERVGAGADTPQRLTGAGGDAGAILQALSELELLGLLTRGHGGRYVPRQAVGDRRLRDRW
jgi:DNA processing protein